MLAGKKGKVKFHFTISYQKYNTQFVYKLPTQFTKCHINNGCFSGVTNEQV